MKRHHDELRPRPRRAARLRPSSEVVERPACGGGRLCPRPTMMRRGDALGTLCWNRHGDLLQPAAGFASTAKMVVDGDNGGRRGKLFFFQFLLELLSNFAGTIFLICCNRMEQCRATTAAGAMIFAAQIFCWNQHF
ncbi:hypothetical protein VPH35_033237 [Triticum aestivum]